MVLAEKESRRWFSQRKRAGDGSLREREPEMVLSEKESLRWFSQKESLREHGSLRKPIERIGNRVAADKTGK
jgi:hypothetical protein